MNIVITGASSGIGSEIVKAFTKEDSHSVVAIARRRQRLEQLEEECRPPLRP